MKKILLIAALIMSALLASDTANTSLNTFPVKVMSSKSYQGSGELSNIIDKVCINGYVYFNIYQRKPVMTITYGSSTALTKYPVLQSTVQSFVVKKGMFFDSSVPETCSAY